MATTGKITYNDGKINRIFSADEEVPEGWNKIWDCGNAIFTWHK